MQSDRRTVSFPTKFQCLFLQTNIGADERDIRCLSLMFDEASLRLPSKSKMDEGVPPIQAWSLEIESTENSNLIKRGVMLIVKAFHQYE